MARSKRKESIAFKKNKKPQIKKRIFGKIKLTESYTSLILGAIAVLVLGIFFVSFAKINRNLRTSSTKIEPTMEDQTKRNTSSTYTVRPGDDLWSISENIYKDGYKWVEIATANKLENPGLIFAGNKLMIPTVNQKPDKDPEKENSVVQNNSITGSNYKIQGGDNLWDIAVRAYGDGYKWPEIAKTNTLKNPDLIYPDNILNIPRNP